MVHFNYVIDRIAKKKGFKSLSKVATAMNKETNTFFTSLKYLSEKRNFHSKFAQSLIKTLNTTEEALRKEIDDYLNLDSVNTIIEKWAYDFLPVAKNQNQLILKVLRSLDFDDDCTVIGRYNELVEDGLLAPSSIISAILKGAKFTYFFTDHPHTLSINKRSAQPYDWIDEKYQKFIKELETAHATLSTEDRGFNEQTPHIDFEKSVVFIYGYKLNINTYQSYIIIRRESSSDVFEKIFIGTRQRAGWVPAENTLGLWYPMSIESARDIEMVVKNF